HTLLNYFLPVHNVRLLLFIIYVFLAGLGSFLFLKCLKLGVFPATFGAFCYMFSGSLMSTTYAGHLGRAISVALLPLMLLFIHKGVKQKKFYFFVFFAAITSLSFLAGHFQMTYYATGLGLFFFIFLLTGQQKPMKARNTIKIIGFFIFGLIVLGMIVSISFLPVYKNLSFGARGETKGYEYTTSWSMPTAELLDLFVPEFSGLLEHYWGENYFKLHTEYFGIITLLLLLIGLLFSFKNRDVKFFLGVGIVALILALGKNTPLFKIAYYIIPGIKKFRAPSLIFFLLTFSAAILGSFGLKRILEGNNSRKIIISMVCFLGCLLVVGFISTVSREGMLSFLKSHFSYLQIPQNASKLNAFTGNYSFFLKGLGKAIIVVIAGFILILLFLRKRLRAIYVVVGLLLVLVIDQWTLTKRYLVAEKPAAQYYKKDAIVSFLEEDKSLFRVFPLHYRRSNDGILIYHGIESLGGYHPNPLRRFQELIGAGESVMFTPLNLIQSSKLVDVLNGKYIIGIQLPPESLEYRYDERTRGVIREWRGYFSHFQPVHNVYRKDTLEPVIYKNNNVLPRAFFVEDFKVIQKKEQILQYMMSEEFNPWSTVILEEDPGIAHPDTAIGGSNVSIKHFGVDDIEINVDANTRGFLVLSENYFPQWTAYVDGQKTRILLANYTLRAVLLNKGKHDIRFVYEDSSFSLGKTLHIIGLIILLTSCIFQFFDRAKKRKVEGE
ncbi:MAG: hypothetical protein E3J78_02000, partial [Candidatus Cloacimonadota bacterium]